MSRLSQRGTVAAFTAVTCLAVALLAAAGGESRLAIWPAALAGVVAVGLAVRDRLGTRPSTVAHLGVGAACGLGALASLPGEQWFTAAALAGIGVMNVGTGVGWRVAETDGREGAEPEE